MRKDAYMNNQDILNWYKTPLDMQFTEQGNPILQPCSDSVLKDEVIIIPFNYAMNYKGDKEKVYVH